MKQSNKFLLKIVMDLSKIHDFLVKQDTFSAGFELGALLNTVVNYINEDEREAKNAEVQEEEGDEECEEGSEEEDSYEDSYFLQYTAEKELRIETENKLEDLKEKTKKIEETNKSINETKRCIIELHDILMRLLKFKKISKEEVDNVVNILRNTGVDKSDIDVICMGKIK